MRKVIVSMHISLDGFSEGPNGELDWFIVDKEGWENVNELLSSVDTLLLGRVTYQNFENFWPAAATKPSSTKEEIEFSQFADKVKKIVFSKSLEKVEWKNSKLIKENIGEEILKLKQQPGGNMVIFGGAGIVSTFTDLRLIDEYRIYVNPIILGAGKPLFKNLKVKHNLKLMSTTKFDSGLVQLSYQPQWP
jgi:dihydrofolate reductase